MSMNEDIVNPVPGIENLTYEDVNILLNIQRLWIKIIQWRRNYLYSVLENHPAQSAVGTRFYIKLQEEIYNEIKKYFSEEQSQQFLNLFSGLIEVNWQLLNAYKNNDTTTIDFIISQWYLTADKLAAFLATVNKYLDETQLRTLLYDYINLKINQIIALLNSNYDLEIEIYDEIEDKVVQIASYIAMGIIAMRHMP